LLRRNPWKWIREHFEIGEEIILEWRPLCTHGSERMHLFENFCNDGEYFPYLIIRTSRKIFL